MFVAEQALQPGWLCVLNRVCGAQRTSAVLTPWNSCSGMTDSPGTSPARHALLAVSMCTGWVSPAANCHSLTNRVHPSRENGACALPGGLRT